MLKTKWRVFGLVAIVGLSAAPATAFYFPGYPGDGMPLRPTVMAPGIERPGSQPSPILAEDPLDPSSADPPLPLDPPPDVPEPATVALAAIGVGVVAVRRWVRRQEPDA